MDIPGFQIKRTIGKGGMGTVYLATQESLGRSVVLKTMNVTNSETPEFFERFTNEGRIVASLRHPNIITVYDIGTFNDMLWISMEYVEGGDLKGRVGSVFAPPVALDIIIKIGSALGIAHRQGIVHRDVKPANILFRDDDTPMLSDFGIAKQTQIDSELTSTGTILGSPFYMSPEQAEGMAVDGRTDLYSLGVIFYEMLTGSRPYQGDSAVKVILQHIQSPLPELTGELARFQPLLAKMMDKNRDNRFPDAPALVSEAKLVLERELHPAGAGETGPRDAALHGASVPATAYVTSVARDRVVRLLLALLALVTVSFASFYAYTESLKSSSLLPGGHYVPGAVRSTAGGPPQAVQEGAPAAGGTVAAIGPAGTSTPEPLRADVIRALEWLARSSLREDRLTSPPADNAHYYFQRLLALDPGNEAALRGFAEIAERFVVLAEQSFAQKDYEKALDYIRLGLQVDPNNEGLTTLRGFIENREKSVIETIIDFVTGAG